MKFGVNYTPSKGWFHSWAHLDLHAVKDDFEAIAGIGADHVRIFPFWHLLQPNRTWIDQRCVDDVLSVVHAAHEAGLESSVDVLQGHLSSFDFLPSWVSTWHRRNIFADQEVVEAQARLVTLLADELSRMDGTTGVSLGNEIVQFAAQRHPECQELSIDGARHWLESLFAAAQQAWPGGDHTFSFDDDVWFDSTQPFTPLQAATFGQLTTVHSWVFGRVGQKYGVDAPELDWFARYICELASAWGPQRRIWLQEVGSPTTYIAAERAPEFLTTTVESLCGAQGGGCAPGLEAITWWCSHDVSRTLADYPEVEYALGLIDSNNEVKPIGEAFSRAVSRFSGAANETQDTPRQAMSFRACDCGDDRSITSPDQEFFAEWVAAARNGQVHAIHRETVA